MSESRTITEAPRLDPAARGRMLGALYDASYAQTMPRDQFDATVSGKSDLEIADATYRQFYEGRIARDEFNQRVGLTSARGSTRAALMQGLSFGLADEVGAGAQALVEGTAGLLTGRGLSEFGPSYNRALTAQRENLQVFRQNNPYLGAGLEVAGGVVGGGSTVGQAPTMLRTVATAAGMGAAQGFGQGEGVTDRLAGAATGAALGAGMAAAIPAVLRIGGGVIGRAAQAAGLGDSDDAAARMLLQAMERDGITPAQAVARLNEWRTTGAKPEALFDIAGENTRRLARTAAGRIGPGTDRAVTALGERQAGQAARISEDAAAGLGQNADDFFSRRQALITQRSTQAAPLYERAFARRVPGTVQAELRPFVSDNIGQDALNRGMRILELEHLASPNRARAFDPAEFGVVRGEDGRFILQGRMENMRLLDAVKRGFDEIVEGFRDPTSGRLNLNQYGRAVNDVRAEYVRILRERFPVYGRALDAWSGPSQGLDALARGRNVFDMRDAEAARAAVSVRQNSTEAEFFRLGVAQAIQERMAGAPDGADAVKRIFGSPAKRALLRAAFPDEASFNRFAAQMRREAEMYRNAQFVSPRTGSQTELRQNEAADLGTDAALAVAGGLLPGRTVAGALGDFGRGVAARAQGVTPEVADALTQRLFATETPELVRTLRDLGQRRIRQQIEQGTAARLRNSVLGRLASGTTAGLE